MPFLSSADFIAAQKKNPRVKARRLPIVERARMCAMVDFPVESDSPDHKNWRPLLDELYGLYLVADVASSEAAIEWSLTKIRASALYCKSDWPAQKAACERFVRSIHTARETLPKYMLRR